MKNLLIITERYYPEPFSINDLSIELKNKGYNVNVLTQIPSYPGDKLYNGYSNRFLIEDYNGIKIIRLKTKLGYSKNVFNKILTYLYFMLKSSLYIFKIAKYIDIVFVYHTGPLTQALGAVLLKMFYRKKTIIWSLDIWPDAVYSYGFPKNFLFSFLLNSFVKFIYKYFDFILVSSPGFIDKLKKFTKKEIIYIPQWADEDIKINNHNYNIDKNKIKFVYTGNIGKMQGLDNLIKAFSKFKDNNVIFYIVGDGNDRNRLEKLKENINADNVIFTGKIDNSQVVSFIKDCDYSVLPLLDDDYIKLTIPAKFFTYLLANKPIFAVTDGEVSKYIEKYNIGIWCKNEENSITEKIKDIKENFNKMKFSEDNFLYLIKKEFNKKLIIDKFCYFINYQ